jgi:hypothetical protein
MNEKNFDIQRILKEQGLSTSLQILVDSERFAFRSWCIIDRSQGMSLRRAVIDLRTNFWEHGQIYVAFSKVIEPGNLCLLFPRSSEHRCDLDPTETPTRLRVDVDIAHIISRLYSEVGADHVVSPDDHSPAMG